MRRGWKCRTCQLDVGNLKCQPKECLCHCVGEGELWEDKKINDESWVGQRLIW